MAKKTLAQKMAENNRNIMENLKSNTVNSFSSTEEIKNQIVILDELRDLIPPLLDSEYNSLKESLILHGCKDPLKVWLTDNLTIGRSSDTSQSVYVLIDGHNRYKICTEHGIPFNIQIDTYGTIEDVRSFIIDFQLSRRNINSLQASYFRGLQYKNKKRNIVENFNTAKANSNQKTTAQELGEYFKVDEKTIRRDALFADGMNQLEASFRYSILSGKTKVDKKKLQFIGQHNHPTTPIANLAELNSLYLKLLNGNEAEQPTYSHSEELTQTHKLITKIINQSLKTRKISLSDSKSLREAIETYINLLLSSEI